MLDIKYMNNWQHIDDARPEVGAAVVVFCEEQYEILTYVDDIWVVSSNGDTHPIIGLEYWQPLPQPPEVG